MRCIAYAPFTQKLKLKFTFKLKISLELEKPQQQKLLESQQP